jgi:hypothetical protein
MNIYNWFTIIIMYGDGGKFSLPSMRSMYGKAKSNVVPIAIIIIAVISLIVLIALLATHKISFKGDPVSAGWVGFGFGTSIMGLLAGILILVGY